MDTFFSVDVPFQITLNLCQVDIKLAYVCAHMHTYLKITCWVHLVLLICVLFFSYIYTDHLLLDNQLGCSSLEKTWFSFNHHQLLVALYVGMGLSEISHIQVACQLVPLFRSYLGDHSVAMSWIQLIFLIQKYCNRYPGPLAFNNFSLPLPVCSLGCVVDVSIGSGHPRCFWPFVASIYNGLHPLQREALMRVRVASSVGICKDVQHCRVHKAWS